ncbi:HDOD domain-containing protein [Methylomarinum vadi]|uniref:HDOD domain-containing protein n=1 Tax=Methylomarinum vadi TaxID=438855 RepID=UPI0004DEDDD0|nr:HDOD domain-containing protein [Methylomarinum vadi]
MNWFSNLFAKSAPKSAGERQTLPDDAKDAANLDPTQNSRPLTVSHERQPLDVLKQFAPLRGLDEEAIASLPETTLRFGNEARIFSLGETSDTVFYLLEGQINMQPDADQSYRIEAGTSRAHLPLNCGKICGATATTLSEATILAISVELNRLWAQKSQEDICCVELVDIELPEPLNDNRFFASFAKAYRENKLQLPSLPNVALKLKEAMQQDIGINEAVEIIQIDPPILTKLIQVANSPLYAPTSPITNCHDAVTRLGLQATRSLVMGISLKQLFNCQDPHLLRAMQKLWKNSLYLSSLSFVLAEETGKINPEDALLAGLISDIGIIPLLRFAEQYPEQYPDFGELENSIPYLRAPVGALMLHTLDFSEELSAIPHQSENWMYDSGEQITLADIVILAKLHSYFGKEKAKELPYINSIPAYAKLQDGKLNPDFSLTILRKAQQRINAAMSILT